MDILQYFIKIYCHATFDNVQQVELYHFPRAVEHLSLKNCLFINLPDGRSYFYKVDHFLPNLKVYII